MQEIIPMMDDFLDAIWDFDESWYNSGKLDAEVCATDAEFSCEDLG